MLPDRYTQLLTAYIDGQLGARQRRAVERLLQRSPEARKLFLDLQRDSASLAELPHVPSPPDMSSRVLRAIAQQGVRPAASAAARPASGFPGWAGVAIAASVLGLITFASYSFFSQVLPGEPEGPALVEAAPPAPTAKETPKAPPEPGQRFAAADLGKEPTRRQLATELRKDTSYHLRVAARDSVKAVRQMTTALKNSGIKLVVDPSAQARMTKPAKGTSYLLYAENVRPDELAALLAGLAANGQTPAALPIDSVLVSAMSNDQRRQVADLLGVGPDKLGPPPPRPRAADEPMPPLTDVIIPAPKDTGKARPAPKLPPAPEREALVVAYESGSNPLASAEVRRFLQNRRPQMPGTLQVVLVLQDAAV
jgi:anti-sigma factor RsiW